MKQPCTAAPAANPHSPAQQIADAISWEPGERGPKTTGVHTKKLTRRISAGQLFLVAGLVFLGWFFILADCVMVAV